MTASVSRYREIALLKKLKILEIGYLYFFDFQGYCVQKATQPIKTCSKLPKKREGVHSLSDVVLVFSFLTLTIKTTNKTLLKVTKERVKQGFDWFRAINKIIKVTLSDVFIINFNNKKYEQKVVQKKKLNLVRSQQTGTLERRQVMSFWCCYC